MASSPFRSTLTPAPPSGRNPASVSAPDLLATDDEQDEPQNLRLPLTPERISSPDYDQSRSLSSPEEGTLVDWEHAPEGERDSPRRFEQARKFIEGDELPSEEAEQGDRDLDSPRQSHSSSGVPSYLRRLSSELCPPSPEPESPYDVTTPVHSLHVPQTPEVYVPSSANGSIPEVSTPTPSTPSRRRRQRLANLSFSLWDYLYREVVATDEVDGGMNADLRAERVSNFLNVPIAIEKMVLFGITVCFDTFLYTFTILPLRVVVAGYRLVTNYSEQAWSAIFEPRPHAATALRRLQVSHKVDLLKGLLVVLSCISLHRITDASQMYHSVRGQETIKLYVIFNVLEILDRLCCSFGQDVLDSLFSRATLARRTDGSQPHLRPIVLFSLAFIFTVAHTLVLFYQLVTLNVAINSYDNALLTLLLSNQFVEIKGSVFKKFEQTNLFQMSCADIVERFQLLLMLAIITFRNLIELSGLTFSHLPTSFALFPSLSLIQTILTPAATVMASEMVVDWLKHAFITKFNHIRPAVYGRYMDILCKDLMTDTASVERRSQPFVDQSPIVSRRLGFAVLPFGCLVVRVIVQALDMLSDVSHIDECTPTPGRSPVRRGGLATLFLHEDVGAAIARWVLLGLIATVAWAVLVALKLLIGINLRAYAAMRFATMEERKQEDQLNDIGRPPIGVDKEERALEKEVTNMLNRGEFDAKTKPVGKVAMEDLDRFTMTRSRIW